MFIRASFIRIHSAPYLFTSILYRQVCYLRAAPNSLRLCERLASSSRSFSPHIKNYQINLLFILDEISDDQDGKGASQTGDFFISALENPAIESHGNDVVEITKQ
jgi:hypothetical protein